MPRPTATSPPTLPACSPPRLTFPSTPTSPRSPSTTSPPATSTCTPHRAVKCQNAKLAAVESPNAPAGPHQIPLETVALPVPKTPGKRQAVRAPAAGTRPVRDASLFSPELDGSRPWHPVVVTHRFTRLCKRAKVDGVRLHDLRHYVGTQLLHAGVDPVAVHGRPGCSKHS